MGRHQTTVSKLEPEIIIQQSALATGEETHFFKKLKPILIDIRKNNKLRGFILKNSTQAIVDLNKPEELAELAVFASQIFNASAKLLRVCSHEQMKSAVLKGSKMTVLCVSIGGNELSIFVDKEVDYERILERFDSVNP